VVEIAPASHSGCSKEEVSVFLNKLRLDMKAPVVVPQRPPEYSDLLSTVSVWNRSASLTRAAWGESSWDANDEAFAGGELLSQVDLVTRRGLDERNGWNGISCLDLGQEISYMVRQVGMGSKRVEEDGRHSCMNNR
jgi:hypothetical protein